MAANLTPRELENILIEKLSQRYKITKSDMKRVFSEADTDKDGFLSLVELTSIFERLLIGVNRAKIQELISCYDINGDGQLSFDEFFNFLKERNATSRTDGVKDCSEFVEEPDKLSSEIDTDSAYQLKCKVKTFVQNLRAFFIHKAQHKRRNNKIEDHLLVHSHQLATEVGKQLLLRSFESPGCVPFESFCRWAMSSLDFLSFV
jgi:hypothetical protein